MKKVANELKADLKLFAKEWYLEDRISDLEKLAEIQIRLAKLFPVDSEEKRVEWFKLHQEYAKYYCLRDDYTFQLFSEILAKHDSK